MQTSDGPAVQSASESLYSGLRRAGPLACAGLAANGANVVVTVVLAHLLLTRGYGALNQLTGVFWVVSTPGTAVVVAVVRRVTARTDGTVRGGAVGAGGIDGAPGAHGASEVNGVGRPQVSVAAWAQHLHQRATWCLLVFVGVALAVGHPLARALGRPDAAGLDAALVAGAVWILLGLDRGLLQAGRHYRALSQNLLVEGGARTACMLALGAARGVTGAAIGLLVAEAVTAAHARVAAHRLWAGSTPGDRHGRRQPLSAMARGWITAWRPAAPGTGTGTDRRALGELTAAVVALALLAVLQQGDVIIMGAEGPSTSGAYAAVSVCCKALVFAALVVAGYLVPEAAIRWRQGSHALRQLGVCAVLLGIPAVVLLVVATVIPGRFLGTVFSARYRSAAGAFTPLALAMICLAGTVVVTLYLLGVGERRVVAILVVAAGALFTAVPLCHGHPDATATADLCVQAVALVAVVAELALLHRRRDRKPGLRHPGRYARQR